MPQPRGPSQAEHVARLLLARMSEDIRKSLSQAEIEDRLVYATQLGAQASNPALSPGQRQEARSRAQQVMTAAPRAVTEQQVADKIAKATRLGNSPQADDLRRQAQQILEENPPAPRRGATVRKAKAAAEDEPIPVFDADGNLVGICDAADVTPVAGKQATPAAPAAMAGDPVTKGQRLSIWDGTGQRYVTTRARIRKTDRPRPGVYDDGPLERLLGGHDTGYGTGVASPEEQARNRGPVSVGGTTGMGRPRQTGPAASLPADGPQQARPGDVPGRQVVKASKLGLPFRTVGEAARERRLARIAKETGWDLTRRHAFTRNPYSPEKDCVCEAPWAHLVHTGTGSTAGDAVAKSSWSPGLANRATEQWLAAQRRR